MTNSNIPVKRTSEAIETKNFFSETTSNSINVIIPGVTEDAVTHSVFPVKSVLKKSPGILEIDKENIDPFTGVPIEWDDLDAEDSGDPLMVSDYVVEIFDYMKQLEVHVIF